MIGLPSGNHGSQVGEQALRFYQALFRIERQAE